MSSLSKSERKYLRAVGHISGLFGAFSFASALKETIEWRTFILQFIEWWQATIRPLLHSLFWWIQDLWPWTWPEWGYDYVVLSLVFGFGGARFFRLFVPVRTSHIVEIKQFADGTPHYSSIKRTTSWVSIMNLLGLSIIVSLLWPICLLALLIFAILSWLVDGFTPQIKEALFLALSPIFYFGVLLLLNYGIFFAEPG